MVTLDDVLNGLKATAESTRLRLLALFTRGELTVSEVTQILRQSQPRVSRHLKLMSEAGLIERFKEGSWVFYRLSEDGAGRAIVQKLSELLPWDDATLKRDLERLDAVRKQREENAQAYFAANASEWDGIRALHIPEDQVEGALLEFVGPSQVSAYLDLGTGTGRILELAGEPREALRHLAQADPDVEDVQVFGDRLHLRVKAQSADQVTARLPETLRSSGVTIQRIRSIPPTLEDVFISLAR